MRYALLTMLVMAILPLATVRPVFAASFMGLGEPGSLAWGVSANGVVVIGRRDTASGYEAFRWTAGAGMKGLGYLPGGSGSEAYAVSADGSVIVGGCWNASGYLEAFRWTSGNGMKGLGVLYDGWLDSDAKGVSADGSVVVGRSGEWMSCEAFRWTAGAGMQGLGDLEGGRFQSWANGVSGDGSVVVGGSNVVYADGPQHYEYEAFRWTVNGGIQGLGHPEGASSGANAISADGRVIVGYSDHAYGMHEATRWTDGEGKIGMGFLFGGNSSVANGVSADGSVIVGTSSTAAGGREPFIWDGVHGMRSLRQVLVMDYGLDLTGWTLGTPTGVSGDGLVVVGCGTNPTGRTEAWVAILTEDEKPALSRDPVSLLNSCLQGQDAPPQAFEVWNSAGGTLSYNVSDDADWLSCDPTSETSTGEHDTISVTYGTSGLPAGSYSATITITDPNASNNPQTISVSLTVNAPQDTLRVDSVTTAKGENMYFGLGISLDLPHDLNYLAFTVEFPADSFEAGSYQEAGRVSQPPASDGIDNAAGTVRILWLGLEGETVIPGGSGPIATIFFRQKAGVSEGTYPVTLAEVEAKYGPQSYPLELVHGQIRVASCSLDVDCNGEVDPATDMVYIYRYLVEMPKIVPSSFRDLDPSIPPDEEIASRIDAQMICWDVDGDGEVNPATDCVYIYRYLVGMPKTVPDSYRDLDPTIPSDEEINARIEAMIVACGVQAIADENTARAMVVSEPMKNGIKIGYASGHAGGSMVVSIALDAPDDDLSYLRFWVSYDSTKLTPTELRATGRTTAEPMSDWLDEENGRIRVVLGNLLGDIVVPKGTGPVVEIVFDVLKDTSSAESLDIEGDVTAGIGPKEVSVTLVSLVEIALDGFGAPFLTWEPFGGGNYTVYYCDALVLWGWVPAPGTNWPITETTWQSAVPDVLQRFYRVQSE